MIKFPMTKKLVLVTKLGFGPSRYQWYEFEDFASFWVKAVSIESKTSKIRLCPKKSTLPVKKSR